MESVAANNSALKPEIIIRRKTIDADLVLTEVVQLLMTSPNP
jgi:hypothetical protein